MIKFLKLTAFAGMALFVIASCEKQEELSTSVDKNVEVSNQSITEGIISLMQDDKSRTTIVDFLTTNKSGSSLENLVQEIEQTGDNKIALENLSGIVAKSNDEIEAAEETGIVRIPELWMHVPETPFKSSEILVSYAPEGNEENWEKIIAYDLEGNIIYLNPDEEPNIPVLVVELNGRESLMLKVELMNKELKSSGLQKMAHLSTSFKSSSEVETTKITEISVKDNEESWVKGSAEMYAITSGIRGTKDNKEAEIQIVGLPYLDDSDEIYYPNQIILYWEDYAYQAANIQIYEQDSDYNYKELVQVVVDGVFDITGNLTAQPWLSALGSVATAVLEVMPGSWYTDDEDYVDSFYTIEKNRTYTNYYGARANAKVSLAPYLLVPSN